MAMRYVRRPGRRRWLAVQDGISLEKAVQQITSADVCLSDLDDTDALSPARTITGTDNPAIIMILYKSNPEYSWWLTRTGLRFVLRHKDAESKGWRDYVNTFLFSAEERRKAADIFSLAVVRQTLFPGVEGFYGELTAAKFYVTRNLREVASQYAMYLGFQGAFGGVYHKGHFVENFAEKHPVFRRYLVRGDSEEDEEMLERLRFLQQHGKVESVIGIRVAEKPHRWHSFEVETSRDHGCLVELLKAEAHPDYTMKQRAAGK